jgi:cell division septum initiation protein DivIVA
MLITQKEMQLLLDQINHKFSDQFAQLDQLETKVDQLETKVEELCNAQVKGPKTSTSGRKRVQQAKADA